MQFYFSEAAKLVYDRSKCHIDRPARFREIFRPLAFAERHSSQLGLTVLEIDREVSFTRPHAFGRFHQFHTSCAKDGTRVALTEWSEPLHLFEGGKVQFGETDLGVNFEFGDPV